MLLKVMVVWCRVFDLLVNIVFVLCVMVCVVVLGVGLIRLCFSSLCVSVW